MVIYTNIQKIKVKSSKSYYIGGKSVFYLFSVLSFFRLSINTMSVLSHCIVL